jgi:hypothetical protein
VTTDQPRLVGAVAAAALTLLVVSAAAAVDRVIPDTPGTLTVLGAALDSRADDSRADLSGTSRPGDVVPREDDDTVLPEPLPDPVRVRVPDVNVDGEIDPVGILDNGELEIPPAARAGWWMGGPNPAGAHGSAVVVGHVDSRAGPGVFFGLLRAEPGMRVEIDQADGSTLLFEVVAVDRIPKDTFPTEVIYEREGPSVLRLITCGGEFDRGTRSYLDNVIVTAVPVKVAAPDAR